jgi:peptidoglycan/LPS O-acetylase OafA/YrhL
VDAFVDVIRFVAVAGAALTAGLVVREVRAGRDWIVSLLLAAVVLIAAPVVVEAANSRHLTWQLLCVAAGVTCALVALRRTRKRPAQVLQRTPARRPRPVQVSAHRRASY